MVTKSYIPSYLSDSDGLDSSVRSGSSDSSNNSYSSDSSESSESSESSDRSNSCDSGDQNWFFPTSKTPFHQKEKFTKKRFYQSTFFIIFFFHQELLFNETNIYLPQKL